MEEREIRSCLVLQGNSQWCDLASKICDVAVADMRGGSDIRYEIKIKIYELTISKILALRPSHSRTHGTPEANVL